MQAPGVTYDEAAELLKIEPATVRGYVFSGRLQRVGQERGDDGRTRTLVSRSDVMTMARKRGVR